MRRFARLLWSVNSMVDRSLRASVISRTKTLTQSNSSDESEGAWIFVSITVHLGPRLAASFNPSLSGEVEQLRVDGLEGCRCETLDVAMQRGFLGRLGTRGNVTEGATAVRVREAIRQPSIGEAVKLLDDQCP